MCTLWLIGDATAVPHDAEGGDDFYKGELRPLPPSRPHRRRPPSGLAAPLHHHTQWRPDWESAKAPKDLWKCLKLSLPHFYCAWNERRWWRQYNLTWTCTFVSFFCTSSLPPSLPSAGSLLNSYQFMQKVFWWRIFYAFHLHSAALCCCVPDGQHLKKNRQPQQPQQQEGPNVVKRRDNFV